MSDQDTPPPQDDPNAGQDSPPPMDSAPSGSPTSSLPTAAPSTAGVGLGQGKLPESDERTMGMLAHILAGVTWILGPLIIWLVKKEESPFVNDQGKEALNFGITLVIGGVVLFVLSFVGAFIPAIGPILSCLTSLLMMALGVVGLVFGILGGLAANKGEVYRYPFALRLIS